MLKKLLFSTALGVCVSQTPAHADTSSWKSYNSVNRLTGVNSAEIWVESDNFRQVKARLIVQCFDYRTNLLVHFPTSNFVRYGKYRWLVSLLYRIDRNPIQRQTARSSLGSHYLILPTRNEAMELIIDLMDADKFLIDLESTPNMTFGFDVSGLREAIKPVREACNW